MIKSSLGESKFVLSIEESIYSDISIEVYHSEINEISFEENLEIKDRDVLDRMVEVISNWQTYYLENEKIILGTRVKEINKLKGFTLKVERGTWNAFHSAAEKLGLPYRPIFEI